MSGASYDRHYFACGFGETPYARSSTWLEFFGGIADRLVKEIGPRSVLDVGCAMGFLVEALRDRGVDAYGIDISEYAIANVREDLRAYCRVASVLDPLPDDFPRRYDLVTCIEVLEHLPPAQEAAAVAWICGLSHDVVFSSTPDDFAEPTHVNVQPSAHWVRLFAGEGLYRDLDFEGSFISPQAFRVRRRRESLPDIVCGYEGALDRLHRESRALRKGAGKARELEHSLRDDLAAARAAVDELEGEPRRLKEEQKRLRSELELMEAEVRQLTEEWRVACRERDMIEEQLAFVIGSAGWRIVEPLAHVAQRLAPAGSRRGKLYHGSLALAQAILSIGRRPPTSAADGQPGPSPQAEEPPVSAAEAYRLWLENGEPDDSELQDQREAAASWESAPLISVVTAVFDPPVEALRAAIHSVLGQSYERFQYVLVDGGCRSEEAKALLREASSDARVRLVTLAENQGIAGNQNAGLAAAEGEFVGFLDHDDVLQPYVLFEYARMLGENPSLDMIYSDEDKLDSGGSRVEPFFKPDWSPELLLSINYITHFTIIRRALLLRLGGFREGFEGSQDYDLYLRATEVTRGIGHLPLPAYSWRKLAGSAATTTTAKPYAYESALRALQEAVARRRWKARVEHSPFGLRGHYRVRFEIEGEPLVSIIIPTRDKAELLKRCVRSIEQNTLYRHFEILILDNASAEPEAVEFLASTRHTVISCPGPFNWSALNNRGAERATGALLLFLNNDVEVTDGEWLGSLIEHAQRAEIGVVGARLLYPTGRVQHAGVVVGLGRGGFAGHAFHNSPRSDPGYFGLAMNVRNCSAVTGACLMVRKEVFQKLGGFNEKLRVAYNDIDFCLRAVEAGYRVVYTPHAELYHHEAASRRRVHPRSDEARIRELWPELLERGDPYYNPNLSLERPDFAVDPRRAYRRMRAAASATAA